MKGANRNAEGQNLDEWIDLIGAYARRNVTVTLYIKLWHKENISAYVKYRVMSHGGLLLNVDLREMTTGGTKLDEHPYTCRESAL